MNILIPDTSSLINIHEVHIGRTHIIDILNQLFDVQVSREIPHEIRRRRDKFGDYDKQMLQFVRQARRYFPHEQDYENLIFNKFSPSGNRNKNRGERYNCALALYLVRRQYAGQIIMLTDDMKAHRGLINWYQSQFKTVKTWTSLELLLHIYFVVFPKWSYDQAYSVLREVNALMDREKGMEDEEMEEIEDEEMEEIENMKKKMMMKRLLKYRRYLMQLHDILNTLPRTKKFRGEL
ncbi:MAG: hypothetical protein OXL96_03160 [Candidatus Poribacteria bacterium]|nr:hypothetical protein [Candidatus Poribacteria bacterium]